MAGENRVRMEQLITQAENVMTEIQYAAIMHASLIRSNAYYRSVRKTDLALIEALQNQLVAAGLPDDQVVAAARKEWEKEKEPPFDPSANVPFEPSGNKPFEPSGNKPFEPSGNKPFEPSANA